MNGYEMLNDFEEESSKEVRNMSVPFKEAFLKNKLRNEIVVAKERRLLPGTRVNCYVLLSNFDIMKGPYGYFPLYVPKIHPVLSLVRRRQAKFCVGLFCSTTVCLLTRVLYVYEEDSLVSYLLIGVQFARFDVEVRAYSALRMAAVPVIVLDEQIAAWRSPLQLESLLTGGYPPWWFDRDLCLSRILQNSWVRYFVPDYAGRQLPKQSAYDVFWYVLYRFPFSENFTGAFFKLYFAHEHDSLLHCLWLLVYLLEAFQPMVYCARCGTILQRAAFPDVPCTDPYDSLCNLFVNADNHAFKLIRVEDIDGVIGVTRLTLTHSWFPHNFYINIICTRCSSFLGWKYVPVKKRPPIPPSSSKKSTAVVLHNTNLSQNNVVNNNNSDVNNNNNNNNSDVNNNNNNNNDDNNNNVEIVV